MRVRIISGPTGPTDKFLDTLHPTEHRCLVVGDEFEIDEIRDGGFAHYTTYSGTSTRLVKGWYTIIDDKACNCHMNVLMTKGCQCGGI